MKKLFVLILLFFGIDIAAQEVQPEEVEEVTIAVEYKAPKNLIKGAAEQLGWTGYIEELEEFVVGFEADGVTEILENRLVKKEQTYIEFMEKYVQTQILHLVNGPYSEMAEKDMRNQLMAVKQKISEENAQRLKIVVSE